MAGGGLHRPVAGGPTDVPEQAADDLAVLDADRRSLLASHELTRPLRRWSGHPSGSDPRTEPRGHAPRPPDARPMGSIRQWTFGPPSGPKDRFRVMPFGVRLASNPREATSARTRSGIHGTRPRRRPSPAHLEGIVPRSSAGRADVFRAARADPTAQGPAAVRWSSRRSTRTSGTGYATDNPIQLPQPARRLGASSSRSPARHPPRDRDLMPMMNGRSPHLIDPPGAGGGRAHGDQGSRHAGRRGRPHARRVPGLRDVPRGARRNPAPRHAVRGSAGHRQDVPREGDGEAGGRAVPVHLRARVAVDVVRR